MPDMNRRRFMAVKRNPATGCARVGQTGQSPGYLMNSTCPSLGEAVKKKLAEAVPRQFLLF